MDIAYTLQSLCPGAEWSIDGSEIVWEKDVLNPNNLVPKNLIWHSADIPIPTKQQIEAESARLQAEYEAKEYQRVRATQYPSITDQLDMLWHAMDAGTLPKVNSFYDAIKAVKDANPKQ